MPILQPREWTQAVEKGAWFEPRQPHSRALASSRGSSLAIILERTPLACPDPELGFWAHPVGWAGWSRVGGGVAVAQLSLSSCHRLHRAFQTVT